MASGYTATHRLLTTNMFGLPQSRPRTWMVYMLKNCGSANKAGVPGTCTRLTLELAVLIGMPRSVLLVVYVLGAHCV